MSKNKTEVSKPFKGDYAMTQPFGVFFSFHGRRLKHQGTDWALPKGTPLLACFDGIVSRVERYRMGGYGRSIYLRSLDGKYEALYAHLNENFFVDINERVGLGQVIGQSGNSGFGTGPHLHYGLKLYGEYIDAEKVIGVTPQKLIKPDEYLVVRGDTLFEIASRFFVGGDLWPIIYHKNKKVIGSDPGIIIPGQVLKIPKTNRT